MKKISLLLAFCLTILSLVHAQIPPRAFNYSAVARNAAGQPIASATIGIQISILKSSAIGQVMYSENHVVDTDPFGLFNLIVGAGAIQSGSMASIQWNIDDYYMKVGMDANGGINFLTMGTTQLLSVPYALHAATADSIVGVQLDGSATVIVAGNNAVITGSGTVADPYIVNTGATLGTIPTLTTGTVQEFLFEYNSPNSYSINVEHNVTSDGGETILSRGICYGTSPNPTTSGNVVTGGGLGTNMNMVLVGTDTSYAYGLQSNTTYYVRAFAVNVKGTAYGNEVSFTTANIQPATLSTNNVSFNSFQQDGSVYVDFSAQLLSDGGQAPALGFCYGTSPNPTLNDFTVAANNSFSASISLPPNTTYYVRAYAINLGGTSYGNQVIYSAPTVQLASVVTDSVAIPTLFPGPSYWTTFYGQMTNNGGTSNTEWGFCYSTSPNPTVNDLVAASVGSEGYANDLMLGQTYYVRTYATNAAGTVYGNQIVFSTPLATVPAVATYAVTNIQSNVATFNGEVLSDGNDPNGLSNGGFCVSTSPNPTIDNAGIVYSFNTVLPTILAENVSLLPNTTYYVRAFTSNILGVGYGNEISFTTLP